MEDVIGRLNMALEKERQEQEQERCEEDDLSEVCTADEYETAVEKQILQSKKVSTI